MKKTLFTATMAAALGLAGLVSQAKASDCTTTLTAVQTENDGKVVVQVSNGTWHVLATADHPAREARLSIALAAYLSGSNIYLNFPTTTCGAQDLTEAANRVRIAR